MGNFTCKVWDYQLIIQILDMNYKNLPMWIFANLRFLETTKSQIKQVVEFKFKSHMGWGGGFSSLVIKKKNSSGGFWDFF